jgi:hypothetical protein
MGETFSFEYPFIMFLVVFEIVIVFLMSLSSDVFTGLGIGSLPSSPTHWYQYPSYILSLFIFFFKFLIIPSVPIEIRFLSLLVFTPLTIVFGWIILKAITGFITDIIP